MKTDDLEKAVAACALMDPAHTQEQFNRHGLTTEDIKTPLLRKFVEACFNLWASGVIADIQTVSLEIPENLPNRDRVCAELVDLLPNAKNANHYCRMLKTERVRLQALEEIKTIAESIKGAKTPDELNVAMSGAFAEPLKNLQPPPDESQDQILLMEYIQSIEDNAGSGGNFVETPLKTLNERSGGISEGEMTIINGMESSGKSILGKQFAAKMLFDHGLPTAVFTAEMPYNQWVNRLVCEIGEINFHRFRQSRLSRQESHRLTQSLNRIGKSPLYIYDRKRIQFEVNRIAAEIKMLAKSKGLKVVLIDYLQKIAVKGHRKDLRTDQEIGIVSDMLKEMCVSYGLRAIVLCSASDDGNVRNSREPHYDADNILNLVVRKEIGKNGSEPKIITDRIMVSKWRDAERGYSIFVEMEGHYCRFRDITGENQK